MLPEFIMLERFPIPPMPLIPPLLFPLFENKFPPKLRLLLPKLFWLFWLFPPLLKSPSLLWFEPPKLFLGLLLNPRFPELLEFPPNEFKELLELLNPPKFPPFPPLLFELLELPKLLKLLFPPPNESLLPLLNESLLGIMLLKLLRGRFEPPSELQLVS